MDPIRHGFHKRAGRRSIGVRLARCLLPPSVALLAVAAMAPSSAKEPAREVPVKQIETAILAYARSIGCAEGFDPRNVVELPRDYDTGSGLLQYFVVYAVDAGCSGGNTMWRSRFAVLTPAGDGPGYFVDPELSRPEATIGFPQSIDRIAVRHGRIVYTAREFDFARDALCCPSVQVTGEVSLVRKDVGIGNDGATVRYWIDEHRP